MPESAPWAGGGRLSTRCDGLGWWAPTMALPATATANVKTTVIATRLERRARASARR